LRKASLTNVFLVFKITLMPALIVNSKGQALRVTMYLTDNVFQFFARSAYRTLLKAPVKRELRDASGAGSWRRI
jgi:hypothetical protein